MCRCVCSRIHLLKWRVFATGTVHGQGGWCGEVPGVLGPHTEGAQDSL